MTYGITVNDLCCHNIIVMQENVFTFKNCMLKYSQVRCDICLLMFKLVYTQSNFPQRIFLEYVENTGQYHSLRGLAGQTTICKGSSTLDGWNPTT